MINFFVSCEPPKSTHQASLRIITPKHGKSFVGKYKNSKAKQAEEYISLLLRPYAPLKPYIGPLTVSVEWTYPWRKAETKARKAAGYQPCDKRPDCDNLCKILFDCMSKLGFWVDDGQIADLRFGKGWGDKPGIGITINEIE